VIILTIRDAASESFMRPFFARATGEGVRIFRDLVNDPDHPVGVHPEDYTLFAIGEFDEAEGVLTATEPRSLGNGSTFSSYPVAPVKVVSDGS